MYRVGFRLSPLIHNEMERQRAGLFLTAKRPACHLLIALHGQVKSAAQARPGKQRKWQTDKNESNPATERTTLSVNRVQCARAQIQQKIEIQTRRMKLAFYIAQQREGYKLKM